MSVAEVNWQIWRPPVKMATTTKLVDFFTLKSSNLNDLDVTNLINDPYSCVKCFKKTVHVALLPAYIGNERKGVFDILSGWMLQYVKNLAGILLSYKNISFVQKSGEILHDQPYIHHDVSADFYTFQPHVGSMLKGTINKISKMHVSCVVHGCINVSLPLKKDVEKNSLINTFFIGQEILFEVESVETTLRSMRVQGIISEKCLDAMKERIVPVVSPKKVNGYSRADDIFEDIEEDENADSDDQPYIAVSKKGKKRKSKHVPVEEDSVEEEVYPKRRKKHSKKHTTTEEDHCEDVSPKRKKDGKKHTRIEEDHTEDVSPDNKKHGRFKEPKNVDLESPHESLKSTKKKTKRKDSEEQDPKFISDCLSEGRRSSDKTSKRTDVDELSLASDNEIYITQVPRKEKKHKKAKSDISVDSLSRENSFVEPEDLDDVNQSPELDSTNSIRQGHKSKKKKNK